MNASIVILTVFIGQSPTTPKADERLDFMMSKAAAYEFTRDDGGKVPLALRAEPAFRMGKQPVGNIQEGAIFFWLGEGGRPEAAAQIFLIKDSYYSDGWWLHEFISLSPGSFVGLRDGAKSWSPRTPGVVFHRLTDAPRPADSAAGRTRQIKALVQEFHVTDNMGERGWTKLRLLPTPVARYGKPGTDIIDGALFAFAFGTDPEAFLLIEVRSGKDGPEWHYAFAPMTCFDLKGTYGGKTVWDLPYRRDNKDLAKPYFILGEKP